MIDDLRIKNADICMVCKSTHETPKGNGLRWCVCGKCAKKLRTEMDGYNENGLYLTTLEKAGGIK